VGEAGVFTAEPVCSWAAYLFATRLRDRGCSAHPVFPAPSSVSEGKRNVKPRAHHAARRTFAVIARLLFIYVSEHLSVICPE
jgi:hypothetical protein